MSAPIKVDKSLSKGLRSSILKQIIASKKATDLAYRSVFQKKATLPTTKKGLKRLHRELAKYLDRYALASSDEDHSGSRPFWARWSLRKDKAVSTWEEDQLSIDVIIFYLQDQSEALGKLEYPVGLSMHLLERTFLRLNTLDSGDVLMELLDPALVACSICYPLFIELNHRGIKSIPIMLPTTNGAVVGDVVIDGNGGDIQLRTFLCPKEKTFNRKGDLYKDLLEWRAGLAQDLGAGFQLSFNGYDSLVENQHRDGYIQIARQVSIYLSILEKHSQVLDSREIRSKRLANEKRKWLRVDSDA